MSIGTYILLDKGLNPYLMQGTYIISVGRMSSSREGSLAIVGTVVDSLPDWTLRVRENCILVTNDQGIIVFVDEASEANLAMVKEK